MTESQKRGSQRSEALLKYKKKSKEELKNIVQNRVPIKCTTQKKLKPAAKRKPTKEDFIMKNSSIPPDSFNESLRHLMHRKQKMRRVMKQQLNNEGLFKRSKEKKLDFSINESPINSNFKETDVSVNNTKNRSSIHRIRNEIIQDDSEDDGVKVSQQRDIKIRSDKNKQLIKHEDNNLNASSYSSNPLQKIIEQRKLESSTDSEESEDELDDDYDIGIDDVDLDNDEHDEIHTATEDEESNILINSIESKEQESTNYHKKILKETLTKPRDKSPFSDLINKGLANYMNMSTDKRQIRLTK